MPEPIRLVRSLLLVAACAVAPAIAFAADDCPAGRDPQLADAPKPLNIDKVKDILRDYQKTHYDGDLAAVAGDARAWVEKRAHDAKNPALVLDIDETSLSNWPNLSADDFGFIANGPCHLPPQQGTACGFDAWVRTGTATAIKPTLELYNAAKAAGVSVFFISSRKEHDRWITAHNLERVGYSGWRGLVLRTNDDKRSVDDYKSSERAKIETKGYTIIANMGDQDSDLANGHAECGFKLPNPFYFIP